MSHQNPEAGTEHGPLMCVVYSSVAARAFSDFQLHELADRAAAANTRQLITGYLYYRSGAFLQYIEGPLGATETLLQKIVADERHNVKNIVTLDETTMRRFPDWRMKLLDDKELSAVKLEVLLQTFLDMLLAKTERFKGPLPQHEKDPGDIEAVRMLIENIARRFYTAA